jgi:diguanylate cyclase (GGDEF)-like protein
VNKRLRLLIVDDSEDDVSLLLRYILDAGYEPEFERVETAKEMASALSGQNPDVVVCEYTMAKFGGLAALSVLKQSGLDVPLIFVSRIMGEAEAIEAIKAGARDYVRKTNLGRLAIAIERELRDGEVRRSHKRAEEWLKYTARHDPLTDLANRNLLYERLEHALVVGQSESKPFALLLMDLDRFKEINDTIGHQAGDALLQQVGLRLQGAVRKGDTIARLGGDEFAVLLPQMDRESAEIVAARCLKAFEDQFVIGEISLNVQSSIGIALFPQDGTDRHSLMRCADVAMYQAKESANGYSVYSPERDSYSTERLALMADLHRAIDRDELFLVYQPKINLATGAITGVEALARWQHSKSGLIPPDQFIALAERSGFIKPLTLWVLEAALDQSRWWRAEGIDVPISVNLSPRTLHDVDFPERVAALLRTHGVTAEQLELEITESSIMVDPPRALDILTRLHRMGISLSIDDFGTGYSSLSYLKKLPANAVKVDKSFVIQMTQDESDAQIVRSTIDLAHNLGLKVIAEGVETEEAWGRLLALGCDEAQGYYVSRPLPAPELTQWLNHSPWALGQMNATMDLEGVLLM